jgi:flagellar basal-body rod protein FlgG
MKAEMQRMNTISNNLANVDVNGYKRDTSVTKAFPQMLIKRLNDTGLYKFPFGSAEMGPVVGRIGTGVEYNESFTVFEQGELKQTEGTFDMALDGKGFFVVDTPQGERYTRNGNFTINKQGMLVTMEGDPVLGKDGPITLKKNNFVVDKKGNVYQNADYSGDPRRLVSMEENEWQSMEQIDTLRVVDFNDRRYLKKQGDTLWNDTRESGMPQQVELGGETKVEQGFLENSNVNPVTEMVKMIEVNRLYEANQKTITTHDQLTGKLLNDMLRV